jgi:hypothetical protein
VRKRAGQNSALDRLEREHDRSRRPHGRPQPTLSERRPGPRLSHHCVHPRANQAAAPDGLSGQPRVPSPRARASDRSKRPTSRPPQARGDARRPPPTPHRSRFLSSSSDDPPWTCWCARPAERPSRSAPAGAFKASPRWARHRRRSHAPPTTSFGRVQRPVRRRASPRLAADPDSPLAPRTEIARPLGTQPHHHSQRPATQARAKREFGAGTRVLFDRMLTDAQIPPHSVPGPEYVSHLEVALGSPPASLTPESACEPPPRHVISSSYLLPGAVRHRAPWRHRGGRGTADHRPTRPRRASLNRKGIRHRCLVVFSERSLSGPGDRTRGPGEIVGRAPAFALPRAPAAAPRRPAPRAKAGTTGPAGPVA